MCQYIRVVSCENKKEEDRGEVSREEEEQVEAGGEAEDLR